MRWEESERLGSKSYICGHCGNPLASEKGYRATNPATSGSTSTITAATIYICHRCQKPTFFQGGDQIPNSAFGGHVEHIPSDEVAKLFDEARNCMKVNAYTLPSCVAENC